MRREVPAPEFLGDAVLQVPPGRPVELDLRLEAVMEGVLVSGTARTSAEGECSRCLEAAGYDVDVDLQELFRYPDLERGAEEDEEVFELEGDLLDLEPSLRDAVVLSLPRRPLCRDDCPGLCAACGLRLADEPDHHHDSVDPRWAALAAVRTSVPTSARTTQED